MDKELPEPAPAPPPIQPDQNVKNKYSFITDDKKVAQKSFLPTASTKQGRVLLVVGGVFGLLLLGGLVITVLSGLDSAAKQDWLNLAQKQQEIIRISEIGAKKAQDRDTKNLATTTKLSLQGSQTAVNALAKKNGADVSSKTLAEGKNSKTDAALTVAEQANKFDTVFYEILKTELNEYQALLKKLYDNSTSKSTKEGLQAAYNSAEILANEAKK